MKLITNNFGLKFTALFVSVVLWVTFNYLSGPQTAYTKTVELPLATRGTSSKYVVTTNVHTVSIELTGPRNQLDALSADTMAAYVDCAGKGDGTYALPIDVVGAPTDRLHVIAPTEAIVVIDRYAYRTVPVEVTGPLGTAIEGAAVIPREAVVAGGQSQVSQVVAAVANVSANAIAAHVEAHLRIVPVDADNVAVAGVSVSPTLARVKPASGTRPKAKRRR